jgi:hypothetical protein
MAGPINGGQILTPNPNTVAGGQMAPTFVNGVRQTTFNVSNPVAGLGGDRWGAYGGGIGPVAGPLIKNTLSNGMTPADYIYGPQNPAPVLAGLAAAAVAGITLDVTADDQTIKAETADQESPGAADSQV